MARFIDQQSASTNIADLIGSIVRDAQGGIEAQKQQKKDDEEALFQKAIDLAELEISRGEFNLKANPIQKPPTVDERIALLAEGLSLEELVKLQMRMSGKDQIKAKNEAATGSKSAAAGVLRGKTFTKSRETSELVGEKTITTTPPFDQPAMDSLNAAIAGQPFPVFDKQVSTNRSGMEFIQGLPPKISPKRQRAIDLADKDDPNWKARIPDKAGQERYLEYIEEFRL